MLICTRGWKSQWETGAGQVTKAALSITLSSLAPCSEKQLLQEHKHSLSYENAETNITEPQKIYGCSHHSPAKALEIRSFFHSQGWSYSSGGRSSSSGSRDSLGLGQAEQSLSMSSTGS